VDDSEEILLICRTVLESGGYQVLTAANGPEALRLLQSHSVDVAVIDSVMPGMCGHDLAREIKRVSNVPGIPTFLKDKGRLPCVNLWVCSCTDSLPDEGMDPANSRAGSNQSP
jgi:CheY-like chemotaxis protein